MNETLTLNEILIEKSRIEKEITKLIKDSLFCEDQRISLSNITLSHIDRFNPTAKPYFIEAHLNLEI